MTLIKHMAAAVAIFTLSSGLALAEPASTDANAVSKPAQTETKSAETKAVSKSKHHASIRSDLSKECSAQADAKQLHGKDRKAFRKACMKDEKTSASLSPASALKAKIASKTATH